MEPRMIFISGVPSTGKTTFAQALVKNTDNALLLEKDIVNRSLLMLRPVDDGPLTPTFEYLKNAYPPEQIKFKQGLFSPVIELPWGGHFYGRHVRDQTNQALVDIAKRNLELGKSPVFESIFPRHFTDGTVKRLLDYFGDYHTAILYLYAPENVVKQRMIERLRLNPSRADIDTQKLLDGSSWREYMKSHPIFPDNLEEFEHYKINTLNSLEKCIGESIRYLSSS